MGGGGRREHVQAWRRRATEEGACMGGRGSNARRRGLQASRPVEQAQLFWATHNLPMATLGPIRQSLPILAVGSMMALPCQPQPGAPQAAGQRVSAGPHPCAVAACWAHAGRRPSARPPAGHARQAMRCGAMRPSATVGAAPTWMPGPSASRSGCFCRTASRCSPSPAGRAAMRGRRLAPTCCTPPAVEAARQAGACHQTCATRPVPPGLPSHPLGKSLGLRPHPQLITAAQTWRSMHSTAQPRPAHPGGKPLGLRHRFSPKRSANMARSNSPAHR